MKRMAAENRQLLGVLNWRGSAVVRESGFDRDLRTSCECRLNTKHGGSTRWSIPNALMEHDIWKEWKGRRDAACWT